MSKAFLILSGYNQRALTAFCRKLSAMQAPFYIIASGKEDFIYQTRYKNKVKALRKKNDLVWDDLLQAINNVRRQSREQELVYCPSSEYANHFVLQNRRALSESGVRVPLVEKAIYEQVTNKAAFSAYCRKNGLQAPNRYTQMALKHIPFVAKPKKNITNGKTLYPYLIFNEEIFNYFLKQEDENDFYYEEYISGGESYYLLFYISKFGYTVSFSQKNILQQAGGKSIVLAQPAQLHEQNIGRRFIEVLKKLGFFGLIMVEVKKKAEACVMIEANPRLWGPSQLFVDNKVPLFDAFIYEALYNKVFHFTPKNRQTGKPYLWLGGILQNRFSGNRLTWHVQNHNAKVKTLLFKALRNDVYLRKDTWAYFLRELKINLYLRK